MTHNLRRDAGSSIILKIRICLSYVIKKSLSYSIYWLRCSEVHFLLIKHEICYRF